MLSDVSNFILILIVDFNLNISNRKKNKKILSLISQNFFHSSQMSILTVPLLARAFFFCYI